MTPTRLHPASAVPPAAGLATVAVVGLVVSLVPGPASAQEADTAAPAPGDSAAAAADTTDRGEADGLTAEALASLLPAELPGGFERGDVESGTQQGEPGARADYEGEAGAIRVTLGGISSMRDRLVSMLETQASGTDAVEETSFREHRAFQGPMQGRRQVMVLVGGSLAVRASTGDDLPLERLRAALDGLDWERLTSLAGPAPGG